jgi:thiol-disulfide isomerase/thioredoxin
MGFVRWFAVMVALVLAGGPALAGEASLSPQAHPVPEGEVCPDITLTGTLTRAQAEALGLATDRTPVPLTAIQAEVLIVEVFSMYCPFCQREAPVVNALAEQVARRGLADRVKVIGLGVGNSQTEVDIFRKKYQVAFPLFTDADYAAHKALGEVGTPYFYVLRKKPGKVFQVIEGKLGCLESPEAFLDGIVSLAGLAAPRG